MASLDLGTLVAKIKVEGANTAQSVLRGVSSAMGQTSTTSQQAQGGMNSFIGAITSGLGNVSLFGTNLGSLVTAFGSSEAASIAMGTALGGVVTAGIMAAIGAMKGLASACVEFVKSSYDVGVGFQAQMSKVQAISGSTGQELTTLTQAARDFGKNTVFSASEAAQAMEYTALAGWNAQESIEGLPGILNLAAASSMDLGKASDIITDYLTAFNMEISQSTQLADIMAYTMSHTNTNTEQLGEAYKSCAATATAFGVSCEEASAWLGQLANAGIKGGEAGTALNAVFARLYGETTTADKAMKQYGLTMYESNGKAKNFTKVIGEMQEVMKDMSDEQKNVFLKQVAGVNHLSDFATMVQVASSDVESFTKELENCGGASEKMAQTMTNNIAGLNKSIDSKMESIKLSIFTAFEPLATDVLQVIEAVVNTVSTIAEPIGNVIGAILGVFSPIFDGFNRIMESITSLMGDFLNPLGELATAVFDGIGKAVGFVVDIIVGAVDLVIAFVSPIVSIIGAIVNAVMEIGTAVGNLLGQHLQPVFNVVGEFLKGVKEGILLIPNVVISAVNAVIGAINSLFGTSIEKIDYLTEDYTNAMQSMGDETADFVGSASEEYDSLNSIINDVVSGTSSSFEEMYNEIMQLDDETFGQLKENAEGYMGAYEAALSGLDEYESAKLKEKMKKWEDTHKAMEGSMNYYVKRAEYQAEQEEKIARSTADKKEQINNKYTSKMTSELQKQKQLQEKAITDNSQNYSKDYQEFAKNEEKKTTKYNEELKKRNGKNNSGGFLSSILGGFANGTLGVQQSGIYRVGEFGPETVYLPEGAQVQQGNTTSNSNVFNVTIDAKNVQEFNDIVNMCKGYTKSTRMGVE